LQFLRLGTIYLPNKANKGEPSFETLATKESVLSFFQKNYPDVIPLLGGSENLCRQFLANPIGHLGFVHTNKFNVGGRVLLIGDACHAIIPFFGQGTNCGFEDVLILTELMSRVRRESDFGAVFEQFHLLRKSNADAIAQLSLQNMSEMGEKTADRAFLLFKEVENLIENVIPSKFRSQYAMVCYGGAGNVSYKNALKLGNYQQRIIQDYIKENRITSTKQINMEAILKLVDEKIVPYQRKLNLDLSSISHANL
jgi:kynurenine 3-monooxygenase